MENSLHKKSSRSSEPLVTINQNWNSSDNVSDKYHSVESTSDSSSDTSSESPSSSEAELKKKKRESKKKLKKLKSRKKSESVGSSSESSSPETYSKKVKTWKQHDLDNDGNGKWNRKNSAFSVSESKFLKEPLKMRIAADKSSSQVPSATFHASSILDTGQDAAKPAVSKTAGFHSIQRILMAKERRAEPGPSATHFQAALSQQSKVSHANSSRVGPRARPTAVIRHSSPSTDSSRSASLERWTVDKDSSKIHFEGFAGSSHDSTSKSRVFGSNQPFKHTSVFGPPERKPHQPTEVVPPSTTIKSTKHSPREHSRDKGANYEEPAPSFSSDGEAEQRTRKPRLSRDSVSALSSGICKHSSIVKAIQDGINAAMLLKAYQDKESEVKEKRPKSAHKVKNHEGRRRTKSERMQREKVEVDKREMSPRMMKAREFDSGSVSSNSSKKGFSPMFPSGRHRKRKKKGKVKGFKTKHKNIYDPEFLKDLETIISRIAQLPVGSPPGFPRAPSIFQRRNYVCPSLLAKRRYANVIRPPICRSFPTPSPVYFDSNYLSQSCSVKKGAETNFTRPDSASTRYSITSNLYDFVSSDEESAAPARTSKLSSPGSFSSGASPYGADRRVVPSRPSPLSKDDGSVKSKSDSPASSKSFERSANALIAELESKAKSEKVSEAEIRSQTKPGAGFADEDIPLSVRRERRKSEDVSKIEKGKSNVIEPISPQNEAAEKVQKNARRRRAQSSLNIDKPKTPSQSENESVAAVKSSDTEKIGKLSRSRKAAQKVSETSELPSTSDLDKNLTKTQCSAPEKEELTVPAPEPASIPEQSDSSQTRTRSAITNCISPPPVQLEKEQIVERPKPRLRSQSQPEPESKSIDDSDLTEDPLTPRRRGRPPKKKSESEQIADHVAEAIESVVINSSELVVNQPEDIVSVPPVGEKSRTRIRRKKEEPVPVSKDEGSVVDKSSGDSDIVSVEKVEVEVKKVKAERKRSEKQKKSADESVREGDKNGPGTARRRVKKVQEEELVKVNAVEQHLPLKKRHHHLTEAKADSPKSASSENNVDQMDVVGEEQQQAAPPLVEQQEEGKAKRGVKRRAADPEPPVNSKMISPKKRHLLQPINEPTVLSCDLVENHVSSQDDTVCSDPVPVLPDVIPILNPMPKITLRIKNIDGAPQVTSVCLKKVKRKKINRTGFPSKRKKKRFEGGLENCSTESERDLDKSGSTLNGSELQPSEPENDLQPVSASPSAQELDAKKSEKCDTDKKEQQKEKGEQSLSTTNDKQKTEELSKLAENQRSVGSDSASVEKEKTNEPKRGKKAVNRRAKSAESKSDMQQNEVVVTDTKEEKVVVEGLAVPNSVVGRKNKICATASAAIKRANKIKSVKVAQLRRKRNAPIVRALRKRVKSETDVQSTDEGSSRRSLRSTMKSPVSDGECISDGCLPPCDFPSELDSKSLELYSSQDEEPSVPGKKSTQKRNQVLRKKFIPCGLFSNQFKEPDCKKRLSESPTKPLSHDPNDNPTGLLPLPLHSTKWLCMRRVDYLLPHDCWSMKKQGLLPGKTLPSWAYKKIRNNVYHFDVKPCVDKETHICSCKTPTDPKTPGCGDNCLNRVCYTECVTSQCPVGQACTNQRIQKHQWAQGLQRFMTKDKGFGIKTKLPIKSGDFIVEYTGEVVSEKEFRERMTGIYANDVHHYCLNLDGGLVIDGHRMGSEARFINHSCSPNCEMQKWNVNGLSRMCVFATRDIESGEELSYDYNFYLFNPDEGQTCRCETTECRGVIGGKSQRMTNGQPLGPVINTRSGKAIKTKGELKAMPKSPPKQLLKRQRSRLSEEDECLKDVRRIATQYLKPLPQLCEEDLPCIKEKRCFLIRNYEKVRKKQQRLIRRAEEAALKSGIAHGPCASRRRPKDRPSAQKNGAVEAVAGENKADEVSEADNDQKKALAEEVRIADDGLIGVYTRIIQKVLSLKDDFGTAIVTLLSDAESSFRAIAEKIVSDAYPNPVAFDSASREIFRQLFVMFPLTSVLGQTVARLRKVYYEAKHSEYRTVEKLSGRGVPASFISDGHPNISVPEEEVVVCLCGLPHDEGLMVQCECCETWQHASCVKVANPDESYNCFKCTGNLRNRDRCVVLQPQPDDPPPGHVFFLSYVSKDLHLKQGDHVYVLRDHDTVGLEERLYGHQYDDYEGPLRSPGVLYGDYQARQLDIFQIERIFKDENEKLFVYGHHYLRPHETYHEPSRKFYPNEVLHMPLYESIPIWAVIGRCWVLDLKTYCKGRPRDSVEEHVYICELKVDKMARMFSKCPKPKFPYSTKNFAFMWFDTKLKPVKNYQPHPSDYPSTKGQTVKAKSEHTESATALLSDTNSVKKKKTQDKEEEVPLAKVREEVKHVKLFHKMERLDRLAIRLLAKRATKEPPLDVSYLLERKRPKKKISVEVSKDVVLQE